MKVIAKQLQQGFDIDLYWILVVHSGVVSHIHVIASQDSERTLVDIHEVDKDIDTHELELWLKDRLDEWENWDKPLQKYPPAFPCFSETEKITVLLTNYDIYGEMDLEQINAKVMEMRNKEFQNTISKKKAFLASRVGQLLAERVTLNEDNTYNHELIYYYGRKELDLRVTKGLEFRPEWKGDVVFEDDPIEFIGRCKHYPTAKTTWFDYFAAYRNRIRKNAQLNCREWSMDATGDVLKYYGKLYKKRAPHLPVIQDFYKPQK